MPSPAGPAAPTDLTPGEAARLQPYLTNLDRPVFALRNLPEVVKGALFSRYSRSPKSLRRVLLDEFLTDPDLALHPPPPGSEVATARAEEFYSRVLVGYGDDSVAELAGAHLAIEGVSMLAAKILEDARIGLSPLEKSTRYVSFDRRGPDGRRPYRHGPELAHPAYEPAADHLFEAYSTLLHEVVERVRQTHPLREDETEPGWLRATRARALDLLRGLLPAGTTTNLGLFGNGRAFEYLVIRLAASPLPEARELAGPVHAELSQVIPSFVRRSLDDRHGLPAVRARIEVHERLAAIAPSGDPSASGPSVRLLEYDPQAERRVVAAALFPHSNLSLDDLRALAPPAAGVLEAMLGGRLSRRSRPPRALEHAVYTFELVGNYAAFRDLHRHRLLTQDRQRLSTGLGYDVPPALEAWGLGGRFRAALEVAADAHSRMAADLGLDLAQYVVPMAYRIRWYFRVNLRELYHLCELRTAPQGHPDYRWLAQEMFRRIQEVHPLLAGHARFVDLGAADELERRDSERRLDLALASRPDRAAGG